MNIDQNPFQSKKLIELDKYFDEMVRLFEMGLFPKVFLLNGNKGIGKFTLILHFLNYIFSKNEKTNYNVEKKQINIQSNFYNSILNQTCPDVIFLKAEEGKNIKIEDIRNLKSILSRSSLSKNPRFIVIDEVEFLNVNSANALLQILEEPSENNFFLLTNNQQVDLIETISSRCLKSNIFLNQVQRKKVINYFVENKKTNFLIDITLDLTPGLLLKYNNVYKKYKIEHNENIYLKVNKLLNAYKKTKDKALVNMVFFFIDNFFFQLIKNDLNKIYILFFLKKKILKKINNFII